LCLFSSYLILSLYSTISLYVYSFDVIHSFGYHSFGFKSDAIPGRVNLVNSLSLFFNGYFISYCYELCGLAHTSMLSSIVVLSFINLNPVLIHSLSMTFYIPTYLITFMGAIFNYWYLPGFKIASPVTQNYFFFHTYPFISFISLLLSSRFNFIFFLFTYFYINFLTFFNSFCYPLYSLLYYFLAPFYSLSISFLLSSPIPFISLLSLFPFPLFSLFAPSIHFSSTYNSYFLVLSAIPLLNLIFNYVSFYFCYLFKLYLLFPILLMLFHFYLFFPG